MQNNKLHKKSRFQIKSAFLELARKNYFLKTLSKLSILKNTSLFFTITGP